MPSNFAPIFYLYVQRGDYSGGFSQRVERLEFIDSEKEADQLKLKIDDRTYYLIDHPAFVDDGKTYVCFKFGYAGNMSPLKRLVLTKAEPSFPQNGNVQLSVTCHDLGINMCGVVEQVVYERPEGYTESEIAEEIAKKYGLKAIVEKTSIRKLRFAQSESDIEFLERLASTAISQDKSKVGKYKVYIEGEELHFHPCDMSQRPIASYTYRADGASDLLSFEPKSKGVNVKGAGIESTRAGVDPINGDIINAKANKDNTNRTTLGTKTILVDAITGKTRTGNVASATEALRINPFSKANSGSDQSDAIAKNTFASAETNQIKATAVVKGNPWIIAKRILEIKNVGKKNSGLWWITEVRHIVSSSGYMTEIDLLRNANGGIGTDSGDGAKPNENAGKTENPKEAPKYIKISPITGKVIQ